MLYNVVLVSAAQQSESALRTHMSSLFRISFPLGHHRALSRVPCAYNSFSLVIYFILLFSHSVVSNSETPWTAARQAPLSFTNSQSLLKLMSIESVMPSNHLILCRPFSSCLQSFPASGSFPTSQFFASGGQSIGASASVLPMNIQD